MQAELNKQDNALTLKVNGDLDLLSLKKDYWTSIDSSEKEEVQAAGSLIVCLDNVERADSAGLAWLINLKRDLNQHNVSVSIHNSPKKLIELAKLSNADSFLE
ncbi:lipid asymmetry maintenance protein MlaB [Glaciecola sp. MF2-115]|uniref:STAS domain-containing protein n=1 Tax=Glaciecola sp. MF2-115 TaxID=3384827 RepID=UPI0039A06159